MNKIILGLTILAGFIIISNASAQQVDSLFEPGKLIIKSTTSLNMQILNNTGIPSIDSMNNYYGVSSVEQLFSATGLDPQ
jgi:hypothetical protein